MKIQKSGISRILTFVIIAAIVIIAGALSVFYSFEPRARVSKVFTLIAGTGCSNCFDINLPGPNITVKAGDTVTIYFENRGNRSLFGDDPHDLRIVAALPKGYECCTPPPPLFTGASTGLVVAGQNATITFVANKSGSFLYACFQTAFTPGIFHAKQGMYGGFAVEP